MEVTRGNVCSIQQIYIQFVQICKMNIVNGQLQLGITYTLNPTLYLNGQHLLLTTPFISHAAPSEREINLETSFLLLQQKCNALIQENLELKSKLQELTPQDNRDEQESQQVLKKRKFIRRKEDELDKKFKCVFENCKKEYASTLALNLHIKNKHNGGTKKQMDDLAKKIIEAQLRGEDYEQFSMRLPEGYVENYRKEHFSAPSSITQIDSNLQY